MSEQVSYTPAITYETAHQVALQAAMAAARVQQHPSDMIGTEVAQAYMQAMGMLLKPPKLDSKWTDAELVAMLSRERPKFEFNRFDKSGMSVADPFHPDFKAHQKDKP